MTARDTFDLTITRTIRAPREKIFEAFIKPELARKWFGIRGFTITRADIDARVGGHYRMTMQPRNGDAYNVIGEYREIAILADHVVRLAVARLQRHPRMEIGR